MKNKIPPSELDIGAPLTWGLEIHHGLRLMEEICAMLRSGVLRVGNRIPDKRELARRLQISMAGVQIGIHYLCTLDVLKMQRGVGVYVTADAEKFAQSEMDLNHDRTSWSVA
jgi:DNA-binding GntR family transcriptional regulator